jgi:hypothetical protein
MCCCNGACQVLDDEDLREPLLKGIVFLDKGATKEGGKGKGLRGSALYMEVVSSSFKQHFQEDEEFRALWNSLTQTDIVSTIYHMTAYREKRMRRGLVQPPKSIEFGINQRPLTPNDVKDWTIFADIAYMDTEKMIRTELAKFDHQLVSYSAPMQLFEPAFFVSMSTRENNKIVVVSVKGTSSGVDWLTSLWVAREELRIKDCGCEGETDTDCSVHGGIAHAARFVLERIGSILRKGFYDAGFSIIFVGHSLGAAVATVMSIIMREEEKMERVYCYAFAPPPVVSRCLAIMARSYVYSVINNDDVIPRTGLKQLKTLVANIRKVVDAWYRVGSWEGVEQEWDEMDWNQLEAKFASEWREGRFDTCVAGRILFLYNLGIAQRGHVEVACDTDTLRMAVLSNQMISDHELEAYKSAMRDVHFVV